MLLTACGSQDMGVASVLVVAEVQVDPPSGSVVLGQTLQLTATPRTEGGIPLPAGNVVWSTTNAATATVSADGIVTGHSVGGPVRIRATLDGVTGETQITVVPLPVDHVVVSPASSNISVGQQATLTATAYDAANNALPGRSFTWSSAASGTVDVTTTGLALGIAPGGPVQITATADGKSGAASVTVTQRVATRLGFLQQPSPATAGQAVAPPIRVAVQDDALGIVGNATASVTIALGSNPGGATLSGTRTVAAVNGIATFSNLSLDRAGSGYALVATAAGLASATSNPFSITAGAPAQVVIVREPSVTAAHNVAFASQPSIKVMDASGNPLAGITVTVGIHTTVSGSGKLAGTLTAVTTTAGVATFSGVSITKAGRYILDFSAGSLTTVSKVTITVL